MGLVKEVHITTLCYQITTYCNRKYRNFDQNSRELGEVLNLFAWTSLAFRKRVGRVRKPGTLERYINWFEMAEITPTESMCPEWRPAEPSSNCSPTLQSLMSVVIDTPNCRLLFFSADRTKKAVSGPNSKTSVCVIKKTFYFSAVISMGTLAVPVMDIKVTEIAATEPGMKKVTNFGFFRGKRPSYPQHIFQKTRFTSHQLTSGGHKSHIDLILL